MLFDDNLISWKCFRFPTMNFQQRIVLKTKRHKTLRSKTHSLSKSRKKIRNRLGEEEKKTKHIYKHKNLTIFRDSETLREHHKFLHCAYKTFHCVLLKTKMQSSYTRINTHSPARPNFCANKKFSDSHEMLRV